VRLMGGVEVLTVSETAQTLSVSEMTVRRLIAAGALRPLRLSERGWQFIPVRDVDRLVREARSA
jgi:excisionase family DNA binding protein